MKHEAIDRERAQAARKAAKQAKNKTKNQGRKKDRRLAKPEDQGALDHELSEDVDEEKVVQPKPVIDNLPADDSPPAYDLDGYKPRT